jgi:FMN-dependent NADH-azoreductase
MTTLLYLRTSLFSEEGQSSRLAERYVTRWQNANPQGRVVLRDLARDPVPHLNAAVFRAFGTGPADRSPTQHDHVAFSDALIDELRKADVIVLGLPMYNFGIPSTLKAYFDHIARSGVTFRYTEDGPEGLLKGKKVLIFAARGGIYAGTDRDTQTRYVRNFLGFLGMREVEFIYAEGLAMNDARRPDPIETAHRSMETLSVTGA